MADLPQHVDIFEEGPREGFQIEPGPIPTADKIALIEALAETGLRHIQICSFVNTAPGARLGRCRGGGGGLPAEAGRPLRRALVQRERAEPRAGLRRTS